MGSENDQTFDLASGDETFLDFNGNEQEIIEIARQFLQFRWNKFTIVVLVFLGKLLCGFICQ
jgi:hypothetical protein